MSCILFHVHFLTNGSRIFFGKKKKKKSLQKNITHETSNIVMCISILVLEHAYEIEWDILMVQNVCNNEIWDHKYCMIDHSYQQFRFDAMVFGEYWILLTNVAHKNCLGYSNNVFSLSPFGHPLGFDLMDWFSWWTTHRFWLPSYIGVNQKIVISNFKCFNFVFSKVLIILDVVHNDVLKLQLTTPIYLNV